MTTSSDDSLLFLELLEPLDREMTSQYALNVSARDGGSPPRFGFLSVLINVRDVNDNAPVFANAELEVTVNETVAVGTEIATLTATDADVDENARVTYRLQTEQDQFWIDSSSGVCCQPTNRSSARAPARKASVQTH